MKKIVIGISVALVAGLFFGFLWGRSLAPIEWVEGKPLAASDSPATSSTASLMLDYGDGRVRVYPDIAIAEGETMIELLEKQAKIATINFSTKKYSGIGLLVEQIGEKKNGENGNYWQYWVNNRSITYAADVYIVRPGDVIEWKFLNYK